MPIKSWLFLLVTISLFVDVALCADIIFQDYMGNTNNWVTFGDIKVASGTTCSTTITNLCQCNLETCLKLQNHNDDARLILRNPVDASLYRNIVVYYSVTSCGTSSYDGGEWCTAWISFNGGDVYYQMGIWGNNYQNFPRYTSYGSTPNNADAILLSFVSNSGTEACCVDSIKIEGDKISTSNPTNKPTPNPTDRPTNRPTPLPTNKPTRSPIIGTLSPTNPTEIPTSIPTFSPTVLPTTEPTMTPSMTPTNEPTMKPTNYPTSKPVLDPTKSPSITPTIEPTLSPTDVTTISPTNGPSINPSIYPTLYPTKTPSVSPTNWISESEAVKPGSQNIENASPATLYLAFLIVGIVLCCLFALLCLIIGRHTKLKIEINKINRNTISSDDTSKKYQKPALSKIKSDSTDATNVTFSSEGHAKINGELDGKLEIINYPKPVTNTNINSLNSLNSIMTDNTEALYDTGQTKYDRHTTLGSGSTTIGYGSGDV